jgi:hypothetical protein
VFIPSEITSSIPLLQQKSEELAKEVCKILLTPFRIIVCFQKLNYLAFQNILYF